MPKKQTTASNDKCLMETLLNNTKSACDLYLHGTIESSTPEVHKAFDLVLSETLSMQNEIYGKMSAMGWYPSQTAKAQQIQQTKTQHSKTR